MVNWITFESKTHKTQKASLQSIKVVKYRYECVVGAAWIIQCESHSRYIPKSGLIKTICFKNDAACHIYVFECVSWIYHKCRADLKLEARNPERNVVLCLMHVSKLISAPFFVLAVFPNPSTFYVILILLGSFLGLRHQIRSFLSQE